MFLLDRWHDVLARHADSPAVFLPESGQSWTFRELDQESRKLDPGTSPIAHPSGNGLAFILAVLNAWRTGQVVCPLEAGQLPPVVSALPPEIVHLKTTSASSGPARLVAFTAEQLAADADNIVATMGLRRDWPNLAAISLAHSYGFSNLVLPLLLHGIPLILAQSPLPEAIRHAATGFASVTLPGVPALWKVWLESGILDGRIKLAISAGAPLSVALEQAVFAATGIKVHNFYGSSECGGIAYDRSPKPRTEEGFVGHAMENVSLSIGDWGCLEVRGAAVGWGYWPEASDALEAGVFRTSDIAEILNACVHLRGRAGDIINVAGRKLHPETVERALERHDAVQRCVVFGVPDADRSEKVIAVVHLKQPLPAETLRQHLLAQLSAWQVPKDWWLTDELEPDVRGKVSRSQWKERFLKHSTETPS
jgi:long-chain acyl-CoA synthetase